MPRAMAIAFINVLRETSTKESYFINGSDQLDKRNAIRYIDQVCPQRYVPTPREQSHFSILYFNITYCIIKNYNTDMATNDNDYLARTKGHYNTIDLPFSRLVPLIYTSIVFIFGVGLIVIFIFSVCICFRPQRTDCNNQ